MVARMSLADSVHTKRLEGLAQSLPQAGHYARSAVPDLAPASIRAFRRITCGGCPKARSKGATHGSRSAASPRRERPPVRS